MTLLFSDARVLLTKTVCLVIRTTVLRKTSKRIMKSSKINRWTCAALITVNSSWMPETQSVWTKFNNHNIFLRPLKDLRILFSIFRLFLPHLLTSRRQLEQCKWTQTIWWDKYAKIRLNTVISQILPVQVTVISQIFNNSLYLHNSSSIRIGCPIKFIT
jgi:hypothetical protein